MKKLSIIITFYNNSKYLNQCTKIIKRNVTSDREIIVIDDGSRLSELQELEKAIENLNQNNLVFLKNEKNMGAGFTKNRAIQEAKGEYVIFLDSDDIVDSKYYDEIIAAINQTKAEIICTDIIIKTGNDKIRKSIIDSNLVKEDFKKLNKNYYLIKPKHILGNQFSASACNKAIKKSIINKYRFNENKCDDLTAIIPSVCEANEIVYIRNVNYYYIQTESSLTRGNNLQSLYDSLDSLFKTFEIMSNNQIVNNQIELFYANNVLPFIRFSILNNNELYRFKLCNHLKRIINDHNFQSSLVTENPYLNSLKYIDCYIFYLLQLMEQKRFKRLNAVVLKHKFLYKLKNIFHR